MYKSVDNEMVFCPYDRCHVVSKLRIQKHIIKCQKNNPDVKLATCFYNYTHRLKPEDMLKHYEICSHKTRVDGARYYETGSHNLTDLSLKINDHTFNFPKTHAKTQIDFYNPYKFSYDSLMSFELEKNSLNFEHKNNYPDLERWKKNSQKNQYHESDSDDDHDLRPLPLPRTVSKAFTCIKQHPEKFSSEVSKTSFTRGLGRGKMISLSTPKPLHTSDHLLPQGSEMEIISPEEDKISKFFSKGINTSCTSFVTSMFDDAGTLKSQDIIFGDGDDDDDDDDDDDSEEKNGHFFKNFFQYVKI